MNNCNLRINLRLIDFVEYSNNKRTISILPFSQAIDNGVLLKNKVKLDQNIHSKNYINLTVKKYN